ncbi:MAG: AlpA family phage regulatory protein [Oxalobacter sp.]|nr:AlpA family phage regulatory protein [Oxalobacter sp.]
MSYMLLRLPEAAKSLGLPSSSFFELRQKELIPPPVSLGKRRVAYVASEIEEVAKAFIQGKSEDEIRSLVRHLVKARQSLGLPVGKERQAVFPSTSDS